MQFGRVKKALMCKPKGNEKMKKLIALLMVLMMVFSACSSDTPVPENPNGPAAALAPIAKEDLKVGFVYIGKIDDEGYTQAHDQSRLALEAMGIATLYVEDVPENADCEAAIRNLIDQGCNVIYSTSFGFMDYTLSVAEDFPSVYFSHCSGYKTADNMSRYFGRIYEARYLSGIAAGLKTDANKIGYVAAMPIPEVIRGINAFTLGVRSVNPEATVEVFWTNTWYDPGVEKQAAIELLNKGCDVLAQHQDTTAPQIAAQDKGAFAVGYNSPTSGAAPKAYLTAPLFHWEEYVKDDIEKIMNGTWQTRSYWEGLSVGMVSLDTLSDNCAEGTAEAIQAASDAIVAGELYVFAGPVKNQKGEVIVPEGTAMTDDEVWNMSYFVEGVIGDLPNA